MNVLGDTYEETSTLWKKSGAQHLFPSPNSLVQILQYVAV